MRVLIGGEYSGTIRDAFLARGHDALSCDLSPSTSPGPHYQGDWNDLLHDGWDLAIFHPTCTFMPYIGVNHLYKGMSKANRLEYDRWFKIGEDAAKIWDLLQRCPVERVAIGNHLILGDDPVMSGLEQMQSPCVQQ